MEDVRLNDSRNISGVGYAWQWKWTGITVTDDNSWVVIGISAVSGDVASLEYVENMISGCKDERVSSSGPQILRQVCISSHIRHETADEMQE